MSRGDLLNDVLDRVADGFLALDSEHRYTYANRRAAQLLGRETQDDLIGRHIWTEFPKIVGSPFHQAYERAVASQQTMVVEDYYAAGHRWFEGRLYPSQAGVSIYFTDITERKRAESALRVSELRYRLAATGGQVWDWDAASGAVNFPAPFWQQLGRERPPQPDIVAAFEAVLHPDDRPRWHHALREHLSGRAPYQFEFRALHANGQWRWFHTQGQAVWDAAGRATYMAGTTFDITERVQAEHELRAAEAYLRSLFEQLSDGVLLVDRADRRILDANPQALAMLGYARDELLRLTLYDLLPQAQRHRIEIEEPQMLTGQSHLVEWEHVRKDGSCFPAEVSARALDAGRYVKVVRDITTRRKTEKALMHHQLELSELTQRLLTQERQTTQRIAQALHDHLGQTLAAARLNLDATVVAQGSAMSGALKSACGQIERLLDQAVREVRQVLVELRPPLLVEQGLASALDNEISARAIAGGGADVLLEVADSAATLRWPGEVEYSAFMVAREAIANARQHAGASLIRVVLGGGEDALSLEVIDDGTGIPAPLVQGRPGHLGIVGMRERSIAIGARFAVGTAPGGGTRMTLLWEARKR